MSPDVARSNALQATGCAVYSVFARIFSDVLSNTVALRCPMLKQWATSSLLYSSGQTKSSASGRSSSQPVHLFLHTGRPGEAFWSRPLTLPGNHAKVLGFPWVTAVLLWRRSTTIKCAVFFTSPSIAQLVPSFRLMPGEAYSCGAMVYPGQPGTSRQGGVQSEGQV